MEEAGVKQLFEVADDAQVDQRLDIILLALRQLLPVEPRGRQHPPRREVRVGLRHHHLHSRSAYLTNFRLLFAPSLLLIH